MSDNKLDAEQLAAMLTRAPFHQWLGLSLAGLDDKGIEVRATWREEFVVNRDRGYTHGGILASLIDLVADYALCAKLGRPFPTIDLRVDYHRTAMQGDLLVRGEVIKLGRRFSTASAEVFDLERKLLASGRGVYHTEQAE